MDSKESIFLHECPLWRRFRNGDATALAQIFSENYESLYNYGAKLVRDDDLVKDCIQNLFLRLWMTRKNLNAIRSVKPYLLKSLRHHIGDQMGSQKRKRSLHETLTPDLQVTFSHEDLLISIQTSQEQRDVLIKSLNLLPARQKEAIFLRFYEGLDYEKIADVMNLNVQSVRNLIYQSIKSIKSQLTTGTPVLVHAGRGGH